MNPRFVSVRRHHMPLLVQLGAAVFGLLILALAPPARGTMLLVPLTMSARARVAALAVEHGAALLGRGPIGGSLLVRGSRAELSMALLAQGVLSLGARSPSCGQALGDAGAI